MRPLFIISLVLFAACSREQREVINDAQPPMAAIDPEKQLNTALDELASLIEIHKDSPDAETQSEIKKSKQMLMGLQHDSIPRHLEGISEYYQLIQDRNEAVVNTPQFTIRYIQACYQYHIKLIKNKDTALTGLDIKYFETAHTLLSKIDPKTQSLLINTRKALAISIQNMLKLAIYQKVDEQLINRLKEILLTHK